MMCISPDQGDWKAVSEKGKVYLFSDDFTHDVKMEISGDFDGIKNKTAYAKAFADWLNERLMEDDNRTCCPCDICKSETKKKEEGIKHDR